MTSVITLDEAKPVRLNKYLALQLGISRREADEYIARGDVLINGTLANLGARISSVDTITVENKLLAAQPVQKQYILINKPAGYLCSRKAQGAPTIYELLPKKYTPLKSVGRLDKDSSGLLLLTNDGDFAHRMTHPGFKKTKVYQVELDAPLQPLHQQMISDFGVMLDDGKSQFLISRNDSGNRYEITMHEGRNRQIRRTFAALGYTVTKLHRTQFGPYALGDIKPGKYSETNIR